MLVSGLLSSLLRASQPPPRCLVQLFHRLKGSRGYALCDTRIEAWLFKADLHERFPLASQEIANVAVLLRCRLIFRQRFSPFPSTSGVSFTRQPVRPTMRGAGRFQPPRGGRREARRSDEVRSTFCSIDTARRVLEKTDSRI